MTKKVVDKETAKYLRLSLSDRKEFLRKRLFSYDESCGEYQKVLTQIKEMEE